MFTTKKTRAISAFAAILMLLSLMTCFVLPVSAADDGTFTIYRKLVMNGQAVMDLSAKEADAGSEVKLSDMQLAGYALTDYSELQENVNESQQLQYIMPDHDITLYYANTVVDLDPLTAALDKLAMYDYSLFVANAGGTVSGETFEKNILDRKAELEGMGIEDGMTEGQLAAVYPYSLEELNKEISDVVVDAYSTSMKLKNEAPYLPDYADKDLYAGFETVDGGKLAGYMISDKEDWFAVLKDSQIKKMNFAGMNFYLKNNVDLKGFDGLRADLKEYLPTFAGTLDGRGYVFENVVINEAAEKSPIGLIGVLTGSGKVMNLGIASGSVTAVYKASDNLTGVAAVIGKAENGAKIVKVWNEIDVTVTGSYAEIAGVAQKDYPVAGVVGIAESGVELNGCYNTGTITGGTRVSALVNGEASVYNSFASGSDRLTDSAVVQNGELMTEADDVYVIGYKLNNNSKPAYHPDGEGIRYTVDANGNLALVFDTDDKSIVKITVNVTSTNSIPGVGYEDYALAGDKVLLDASYASGPYNITSGSGDLITESGKTYLQLRDNDVVVEVEVTPLDSTALNAALVYYANKDASAFENADELSAALERAKKNNYANAAAMAADVKLLNDNQGVYTSDSKKLPAVSEMAIYPDAVTYGYTIRTVADLELVAAAPTVNYGKLYLANDLDLSGKTFDGLLGLNVDFDGLGNTIAGWSDANGGFFDGFLGTAIENVTFSGAKVQNASVVMNEADEIILNNVHVKDAVIESADADDLGFLVGKVTGAATITNSSVMDSKMAATANDYSVNHGILVGNAEGTVSMKNIVAAGNILTGIDCSAGAGMLIGNALSDVSIENAAVTYNTVNAKNSVAEGVALVSNNADAVVTNLFAAFNAANYDGLGEGGAVVLFNYGDDDKAVKYNSEIEALDAMDEAVTAANGYADWTMDATHKTLTLAIDGRKAYHIVTFKVNDQLIATYPTDEFGHLFDFKNTDEIARYTWTGISALATHVFTADAELTAAAAVDHMSVEVVGTVTEDTPANVQVQIDSNPGLRAVTFKVSFDKANFELVNVANGGLFAGFESYDSATDPNTTGIFKVTVWDNKTVSADGVALKLALNAKNGVGDYTDAVTVEVVEAYDASYNPVAIDAESVDITVERGILWGDADGDESVTSADVAMMLKYVVGKINAVTNPAAVELDGVKGLSVVDAQIIFRALENNAGDSIKPLTIA